MARASEGNAKKTAKASSRPRAAAKKPSCTDHSVPKSGTAPGSSTPDGSTAAPCEDALQFLRLLYGDTPPGYLTLWVKQREETRWFGPEEFPEAAASAVELATQRDIYFGVGLRRERLKRGRGCSKDVICIPGLWVDIDIYGEAHSAEDLPHSLDDALGLVRDFGSPPTAIVDSGHGIHAWWLFNQPWKFECEREHLRAAALSKDLQQAIRRIAEAKGWQIDSTHDLARVLRLPGTWNHKTTPVPVQVHHCDAATRYSPDEISRLLAGPSEPQPEPAASGNRVSDSKPGTLDPVDSDIVAAGEYWLRHALEKTTTDPRNETGLGLACQLRDSGLTKDEAAIVMDQYQASVRQAGDETDYSQAEARRSLDSAYSRDPRPPARRQEEKSAIIPLTSSAMGKLPDEPTWVVSPLLEKIERRILWGAINPKRGVN